MRSENDSRGVDEHRSFSQVCENEAQKKKTDNFFLNLINKYEIVTRHVHRQRVYSSTVPTYYFITQYNKNAL